MFRHARSSARGARSVIRVLGRSVWLHPSGYLIAIGIPVAVAGSGAGAYSVTVAGALCGAALGYRYGNRRTYFRRGVGLDSGRRDRGRDFAPALGDVPGGGSGVLVGEAVTHE